MTRGLKMQGREKAKLLDDMKKKSRDVVNRWQSNLDQGLSNLRMQIEENFTQLEDKVDTVAKKTTDKTGNRRKDVDINES